MIADTGFGPLGAYLLHLQPLLKVHSYLRLNATIVVGMLDMIVGALHSKGHGMHLDLL